MEKNRSIQFVRLPYDINKEIEIAKQNGSPSLENYILELTTGMYRKNKGCAKNQNYIGKIVEVKIDRKMGTKHPTYGFIYPVNYGYVPNTISGDGEELDCYVLGVFEPIDFFVGKCIAVIHRLNDNDDKLIIVPENISYTNDQIESLIEFQERFFDSEIYI